MNARSKRALLASAVAGLFACGSRVAPCRFPDVDAGWTTAPPHPVVCFEKVTA